MHKYVAELPPLFKYKYPNNASSVMHLNVETNYLYQKIARNFKVLFLACV